LNRKAGRREVLGDRRELLRTRRRAAVLIALIVAVISCASCRGAPLNDDPDEGSPSRPRLVEVPDAAAAQAELARAQALREVERARERAAFLALPPTAAPIGSARFLGTRCPSEYGLVLTDGGEYCGKICGIHAHGFCNDDDAGDASARCCGTHVCDRRMTNRSFVPPDGPLPSACSPSPPPPRKR
jgi:hypothetical protein